MNPTSSSVIRETSWFVLPNQPLLEYKVFSARVGELLYFSVARRGVTSSSLPLEKGLKEPTGVLVAETADIEDNSGAKFEELEKFLKKAMK